MKCNVTGLLTNAAQELTEDDGSSVNGYAHALRELAANLKELHDRTEAGDLAALKEFWAIYVF